MKAVTNFPRWNRRWMLTRRPVGAVQPEDLALVEEQVPELATGQVLVRNELLSVDPTNRLWMSDIAQYAPPVPIGTVMRGMTVGSVAASRSKQFKVGEHVRPSLGGWEDFSLLNASELRPLKLSATLPLSAHLSVLGIPGLTAYFGLLDISRIRPGETVVVSAAAGGVGSLAGQIAKLHGCYVIGITGGADKCRWIVDELGFDGAIDYQSEDIGQALARTCAKGVDVDFENVGGSILDAVIPHMNVGGRIAICGLVSNYNDPAEARGPTNFLQVLMRRLTLRGFVVADYGPRYREAIDELSRWVSEKRLKWHTHIVHGLEDAPKALAQLFTTSHRGKVLVQLR